jgi:hypothetical protein
MEKMKLSESWKEANVTPLHKKGPNNLVENYRPIGLTSIVCKTMDKFIRDCILDHMERHNLFTTHQHGFRKGRSCVTQLIKVLDDWTEQLDNRNAIDTIYLDFQKAFDTVPHKRLINKLQSYGICGNVLGWIRDFLANRKQKVVINGTDSDWTTVTSGIPQGSVLVLDPILFTIYINDLPDVVQNIAKTFADDTKVYAVVNKEEEQHSLLQNDINNLVHWSDKWLLKFNKSKCKHATNTKYKMGENEINQVTGEKDLGILIDDKLKFQQHINQQTKKSKPKTWNV